MKVLQTIVVKQVLTEESKEKIHRKYHSKKLQLQKECDQLRFERKKLEKSKQFSPETLKKHFEQKIKTHQEKIKLLDFQIDQLHILPLGSEWKETELQGIVEVNIGDQWETLGKTIIVKDGIVTEIRER
ncbi:MULTISPECIES: YlqD family protein [Mesobacillus]|uniref:YlqD protein n=2 Tax=Mesobacillus TaxID=2675231 RepID=A0A0D6Z8H6_9BACI|nr:MULTISPECIES: YlqD family protein [Mesobacillus]KIY20878.1 hypothetical protein UB32_16765 [Mesobacillus subterraneus]MDQ0412531.1 FtsZ-binding cell division protein ZapB [Mesobacillus stamsii]